MWDLTNSDQQSQPCFVLLGAQAAESTDGACLLVAGTRKKPYILYTSGGGQKDMIAAILGLPVFIVVVTPWFDTRWVTRSMLPTKVVYLSASLVCLCE